MPNFGERSTAELFGRLFSLELERALRAEESDYEAGARRISNRLMASAAQDQSLLKDAEWLGDLVSDSIPCDGVGVFIEGETAFSGSRPDPEDFGKILIALNAQAAQQIFYSSRIADFVPGAEEYADRAAGLIAIPISHSPRDYVILFRKEKLQTVRWGGKQEKERTEENGEIRLSPRKSFDTWTQQVRATAEPFTPTQLKIADALRTTLLEVVLQLSEAAAQDKRRASEQQQLLIGELNHRVRNILALIRALMNQTKREKGSTKDVIKTLDHRVQALANAHDQLTADNWAPADLAGLIETEFSAYIGKDGKRLTLSGPPVAIVPEAFTIMALVIHEMTTNAAKIRGTERQRQGRYWLVAGRCWRFGHRMARIWWSGGASARTTRFRHHGHRNLDPPRIGRERTGRLSHRRPLRAFQLTVAIYRPKQFGARSRKQDPRKHGGIVACRSPHPAG